jgi:hypothetical protein
MVMIRMVAILSLFAGIAFTSFASADVRNFIAESDAFFKMYVTNGSVDYKAIKSNIAGLEQLYRKVGNADLTSSTELEKKAFFMNAYNIIVIYWVTKHYPLKSPLDNSGFFSKVKHKVAGEEMTLDALEHLKLLRTFKDARIHFALACAAKSCPPLASFAFTPEKIEQQLTDRAVLSLNNDSWLKVDKSAKKVELSKIFEWFSKDFTANGMSVVEWINQYRKDKIPANYTVSYYEYNWTLNEK